MSDCILARYRASHGYGRITVEGRRVYEHRWVWEQVHGPIPEGMVVMHTCDNPPCVNIEHLRLGTHADNQHDKMAKGRYRRGNRPRRDQCRYGHPIRERGGHRWCHDCAMENKRIREGRA